MSPKQRLFIEEYLKCWNATKAAKLAGYSERTARSIGSENLTKPDIAAAIKKRLDEKAMSADEVLTRLADHARGDFADALVIDENYAGLDLQKLQDLGLTHLIKKYSVTKNGVVLEFYDAQAALVHLGRHHGLFVDRKEITGKGGKPIETTDMTEEEIERRVRAILAEIGTE